MDTNKLAEQLSFNSYSSSMEFSKDGRFFITPEGDNKTFHFWDATTLKKLRTLVLEAKLDDGNLMSYFCYVLLSFDGSYLIGGDSYSRYIFDNNGTFIKRIEGRNLNSIYSFSKTEFVGITNASDYTKSKIVAVDFIADTEKELWVVDGGSYSMHVSQDSEAFCVDTYYSKLYINLKGDKKPKDCWKDITSVSMRDLNFGKVALLFSEDNPKATVVVMKDDKLVWRKTLDISYYNISSMKLVSGDSDTVCLIEKTESSLNVLYVDEDKDIKFRIKWIRHISLYYPYLIYGVGTREIWVQNIGWNVKRYYFDEDIVAFDDSAQPAEAEYASLSLNLIFDSGSDYYRVRRFESINSKPYLQTYQRKISKEEIPKKRIKSFYKIRVKNTSSKKVEEAVLLHMSDTLVILSLESQKIMHETK